MLGTAAGSPSSVHRGVSWHPRGCALGLPKRGGGPSLRSRQAGSGSSQKSRRGSPQICRAGPTGDLASWGAGRRMLGILSWLSTWVFSCPPFPPARFLSEQPQLGERTLLLTPTPYLSLQFSVLAPCPAAVLLGHIPLLGLSFEGPLLRGPVWNSAVGCDGRRNLHPSPLNWG